SSESSIALAMGSVLVLFIILLGACYQWWQKRTLDPLLREYHLLQKEFCRFNIATRPPATLE
ncbi:hypothetical protein, partial [Serratia marcescens]|uniref:hypothetical protein n=1 Tax=Serratia marcescens TaxID=615 RepID=UPI0019533E92